jgi:Flp pilus assembly protein TadG
MLEFALILPILVIMVFGIIEFGRLINARLIVTNVSREGGNLASRYRDVEIQDQANDVINMMQKSATPLDLDADGKIYITKIVAGTSSRSPKPTIAAQVSEGDLSVSSDIASGGTLGLSTELYNHLVFNDSNQTADISEITVAEVFYKHQTIIPLPNFLETIFMSDDGIIIGSKAVY